MGVYHFMGLGKSVGTVTCAVDYIEKALDQFSQKNVSSEIKEFFSSSGGVNHDETDRGKIEAIVLFTSPEVIRRKENALEYSDCSCPGSVREEVEKNLRDIWKRKNQNEGRKIFWCEVDRNNYEECFDRVLKVTYRFSQSKKQGKEIWCNLTGGTNSINFALLSVAQLTGKFTKQYMLSQAQEYIKYITVPSKVKILPQKDKYFNLLPFVTMSYDTTGFFEILDELQKNSSPIKTDELFSRLQTTSTFRSGIDHFKKHFMLKLLGLGFTIYDPETDTTLLTKEGKNFTKELEGKIEQLIELESIVSQSDENIIEKSKEWLWFQEISNLDYSTK